MRAPFRMGSFDRSVARLLTMLTILVAVGSPLIAADAIIDFRTYVPGKLDAPVYRADGTNRVSGSTGCLAQLYVGVSESSLAAVGSPIYFTPDDALEHLKGHIWTDSQNPIVLPGVQAGTRVWFRLRAWEMHHGGWIPEDQPPKRFTGESEIFSLTVSNVPTALVGLKSFSFDVPPLRIKHGGEQVVLRWGAGGGTVYYNVQQATDLSAADPWHPTGLTPLLDVTSWSDGMGTIWFADWVVTNRTSEPSSFYRVELRNP